MATTKHFYKKICEIFSGVSLYHENPNTKQVSFKVDGNLCSLGNLALLSDLLKTDAINFVGMKETHQISSWTSETDSYGEIDCYNVEFPV